MAIATFDQTWTTPGSYSINLPYGAFNLGIYCIGGGGKGGSVSSVVAGGGGGGGAFAGTFSKSSGILNNVLTSYATINFIVGYGGGTNLSWSTNGQPSSAKLIEKRSPTFNTELTLCVADGGLGVATNSKLGAAGGTIKNCTGDTVYEGGYGSATGVTYSGGGGGGAGSTMAGGDASGVSGGSGGTDGGGNGGNGRTSDNNGISGSIAGGGGGGAFRSLASRTGGLGAYGSVRIYYEYPLNVSLLNSDMVIIN